MSAPSSVEHQSVENQLLLACRRACDLLDPANPARGMYDDLAAAREIRFLADDLTLETCAASVALVHILNTSSSVEVCLAIREIAKSYIAAFEQIESSALTKADTLC